MTRARLSPATLLPTLAVAVVLGWVLWWHATILAPFLGSAALAFVLRPLVDHLQRWRVPRALGTSLVLLGLVCVVSLLGLLLVPIVSELLPMLRDRLPDLLWRVWGGLAQHLHRWGMAVPDDASGVREELRRLIETHGAQWSARLWASALAGGSSVVSLVALATLVPLLTFYWLLDWPRLAPKWQALVPQRWQAGWQTLLSESDALMGQYLRGQLLVMATLAVYYGLALSLVGFSLGWPIGVLTGLAICIPYLGFGLGLMLALLAGLLQFADAAGGVVHALGAVALIYGAGQVIEGFFLTPRLVGERIGLHPLGVILALMLFGRWMGLWGVIVALPCAALFMVLARRGWLLYVQSDLYGRT